MPEKRQNRYARIIEEIFRRHQGATKKSFEFERSEIAEVCQELGVTPPKNLGDVIYSFRYRQELPPEIVRQQPEGFHWLILGAGEARYRFKLCKLSRFVPRPGLMAIKIPDATPEIIARYALTDEQALLAKVRYNRLIDLFLSITAYSLQSHLRTNVANYGQIEIDELYVGVDRRGSQYVAPVQAKGGKDRLGVIQTIQDVSYCLQQFPHLICRPVSAQFMADDTIAMFELCFDGDEIEIMEERHYRLLPADEISDEDLKRYRSVK
jgi:hypothetical protein